MDLSKGGSKGSESVPGVSGSPGGSPTRMEMGTANAQVAADTPVPETPPNGLASNQQGFCMGGQCLGGFVGPAPNLAGVANLAGGQSLAGASNLAGVPYLAGQNLAANQFPFPFQSGVGTSGFAGTQNFGCAQNMPCQQGFQSNLGGGCFNQPFVAGTPCPQEGICQGARGRMPPGGLTPQASTIRQVAELVGQLDPNQTRELQVILQERLSSQARIFWRWSYASRFASTDQCCRKW